MTQRLIQCDAAAVPPEWASQYRQSPPIQVNRYGPAQQTTLHRQELSDPLAETLEGKAFDLVSIAAYVYVADQMVGRGGVADIYGESWRPELAVCVPVGDPDFWNSDLIRTPLEQTIGFVSGHPWRFAFSASHLPGQLPLKGIDERAIRCNPDSVILFSGGADSLCAAVEAVMHRGLKPVLVSHRSVNLISTVQRELVEHLKRRIPNWQFPHSKFVVNKVNVDERDTSQRTRSFLFASLGVGVASSLGIGTVLLADNGVVSLNLPINDQLLGSLASRSTHPQFLDSFNALARAVLPGKPQITNPLWNRTKAECLAILRQNGMQELLRSTNSCARRRNLSKDKPQCGVCSQCVDRRFASIAAGLEAFDASDRYRTDIFHDALDGDSATMVESYIRFARTVQSLSDDGICMKYPQLVDAILANDPSPDATTRQYASLMRRHADSVIGVMADQIKASSQDLAAHSLPPTCAICLSLPSSATRQLELTAVALSSREREESVRYRFKSELPVRVTGQTEGRKSNVLNIGGHEVILPDSLFLLFLRLIVALFESDDGFVARGSLKQGGGLADEGVYFSEELDQAVSRLRYRLGPALEGLNVTKYLEVQRGRIRLSTHRSCISMNRELLLKHPDERIRSLVGRLPEQAGSGRWRST